MGRREARASSTALIRSSTPAAGSHANYFDPSALSSDASASEGVGCDDTTGPTRRAAAGVNSHDPDRGGAAATRAYPWIAFQGRWGERQPAFFNGPTGPNLKTQWTEPIKWSQGWRSRSYAVPTGGLFGTGATDFFCGAVTIGSKGLIQLLRNPGATLIGLGALLAIALFAATRTRWRPSAPLRIARRRRWGQILTAAGRMYVANWPLFLGIGLLFIPLGIVVSLLEALVLGGFGLLGVDTTGESAGAFALLVVAIGAILTLLGITLVQAATARALVEIDQGHRVGAVRAYRFAFAKLRPLAGGLAVAVAIVVPLTVTAVLIPVAVWLAVRWALLAQAVELEDRSGLDALRRSTRLVRGRWLRVASLVGAGAAIVVIAGPLLGTLLILGTDAPLPLLNVVAGVVYALAMPFVALTTTYVYLDATRPGRARAQDRKGNVWYMGEATKEYSGGRVSTEGSWRAGVANSAPPGIIIPAHPRIGASYRQEYLKGYAEDNARNMSVDEQLTVPQLRPRVDDARDDAPRAEGARVQVLRARSRPAACDLRLAGT